MKLPTPPPFVCFLLWIAFAIVTLKIAFSSLPAAICGAIIGYWIRDVEITTGG